MSAAEVTWHKHTATGKLARPQMRAGGVDTRVVDGSDWCMIADATEHFGLSPKFDEAALSVPLASPGVVLDVLGEDLYVESDWDLSIIPISGVIYICFSFVRRLLAYSRNVRRPLTLPPV